MKERSVSLCTTLVALALLSVCAYGAGPKVQTLYSFAGGTDGGVPRASLVSDGAGNLYGTTTEGGTSNDCLGFGTTGCGTVFKLSPPQTQGGVWKETVLFRFSGGADGAIPEAGLVRDRAGNLDGTTFVGGDQNNPLCTNYVVNTGCGVVFELSPQAGGNWTETVIYTFGGVSDGAYPLANLIFDGLGNLYGTTEAGGGGPGCSTGQLIGCGTVFELTPNGSLGWTETTLYQFQGSPDAGVPVAGVVFDQTGNLYGATNAGGIIGDGAVFELMPPGAQGGTWTESILYSFTASAGRPQAGVIFDQEGNLFGTTASGNGTAFELTPSLGGPWTETTLYAFGQRHNKTPMAGLISDRVGNLYGTTFGPCGSVFRLHNQQGSWKEAELDFFSGNGSCASDAALTFGKWGGVYGTSSRGGTLACTGGCGTVFAIYP